MVLGMAGMGGRYMSDFQLLAFIYLTICAGVGLAGILCALSQYEGRR